MSNTKNEKLDEVPTEIAPIEPAALPVAVQELTEAVEQLTDVSLATSALTPQERATVDAALDYLVNRGDTHKDREVAARQIKNVLDRL